MLAHPALRPEFRVEVVEAEGVLLLSERRQAVLPSNLYPQLLALLDGSRTTEAIVDLLAQVAPAAYVYLALTRLEAGGYLTEAGASGQLPAAQAAFWSAIAGRDGGVVACPPPATVAIAAFGDVDAGALRASLTGLGLRIGEPGELTIVLSDDPLHAGLGTHNRAALDDGRPWLLVKPAGTQPWIGPLFRPGITACWECLAHRLHLNRPAESFLKHRQNEAAPAAPAAVVPASLAAVCALAAIEVGKVLAGTGTAAGVLTTLDLRTLETARHIVVRRPQCRCCGEPGGSIEPAPVPVRLERGEKRFTLGGGDRTATPEQTLARYGHHVSPLTGVVPELTRVPLDDGGRLHVYSAGRNPAMETDSLHALHAGLRGGSSGKGLSEVQARASALCEALERYSGRFAGDEPLVRASYRQLGEPAIHPNSCMLFSEAQYRDRARWNGKVSGFQYVPEPFDETAVIEWVPIWSLSRCAFRYLPASFCYFDAPGPGAAYCRGDSNGNAAGNTREEAILQGFLELVERDAVAVWWYNRIRRPSVDLESFASGHIDDLCAAYRLLGRELWVLDLTHDLGILTFVAVSRRSGEPDGVGEQIVLGFGSHLDARIGVTRALMEMSQFVAGTLPRNARPSPALRDPELAAWLATATLENQPYLIPAVGPQRRRNDFPTPAAGDLRDDIQRCQALMEGLGLELLVLDQTRPDIGLPVVKVVVPGLRHFWARFAPGRLYHVPVRLGWADRQAKEEELNPVAMFL